MMINIERVTFTQSVSGFNVRSSLKFFFCSGGLNKPWSGPEDAPDCVTERGEGRVEKNHPEATEDGEHRLDDSHDRSDNPHVQDGEDAEEGEISEAG